MKKLFVLLLGVSCSVMAFETGVTVPGQAAEKKSEQRAAQDGDLVFYIEVRINRPAGVSEADWAEIVAGPPVNFSGLSQEQKEQRDIWILNNIKSASGAVKMTLRKKTDMPMREAVNGNYVEVCLKVPIQAAKEKAITTIWSIGEERVLDAETLKTIIYFLGASGGIVQQFLGAVALGSMFSGVVVN